MTATKTRIVTDQSGTIQMIIHPDDDAQLDNVLEFSPPGSVVIDLQRTDYDAAVKARDFLALVQPKINEKSRVAGIIYQSKLDAIDISELIEADVTAADKKIAKRIADTGAAIAIRGDIVI